MMYIQTKTWGFWSDIQGEDEKYAYYLRDIG